jgi:hypothetical protein
MGGDGGLEEWSSGSGIYFVNHKLYILSNI